MNILNGLAKRLEAAHSKTALVCGVAALATVLCFLCMQTAITLWPTPYPFDHQFRTDVDSPALALELARTPADVKAIVEPDTGRPEEAQSREAADALRLYQRLEGVFVPLYAIYLLLFGWLFSKTKPVRVTLAALIAALVLSETAKTVLALKALAGGTEPVYFVTLMRWLLLAVVIAFLAVLLLRRENGPYSVATRRLLAIGFFAIAALMVSGACSGHPAWLALGGRMFLVTIFLNAAGLAGPCLAIHGVELQVDSDFCKKRRASLDPGFRELSGDTAK